MPAFILGEFRRSLDERYRLSIPSELASELPQGDGATCVLAKERPGALSVWVDESWGDRLNREVELIQAKMAAGHLKDRVTEVQILGRLLSTRHKQIPIAGRGRISLPEGFREFLGVEQGGEVMVVGAAVCIEIWNPAAWVEYLNEQIGSFGSLVEELAS